MFQKRIRKAGSTAKPMHRRMAESRRVTQVRRAVPTAPLQMPAYTLRGFMPVMPIMTNAQTTSASKMATRRISDARTKVTPSRLTI